jgi:hypothetical protein
MNLAEKYARLFKLFGAGLTKGIEQRFGESTNMPVLDALYVLVLFACRRACRAQRSCWTSGWKRATQHIVNSVSTLDEQLN